MLDAQELEAVDQISSIRDTFDLHILGPSNESSDDEFDLDHPPSSEIFRLSSPHSNRYRASSSSTTAVEHVNDGF